MRLSEKDCLFFINSNSSFCCINLFINFTPLFIDSAIFLLISPSFLSITLSSFCCTNLFINFAPLFIDKVHVEFGMVALARNILKVAGIRQLLSGNNPKNRKESGENQFGFLHFLYFKNLSDSPLLIQLISSKELFAAATFSKVLCRFFNTAFAC